jgi:hypothetical protein
MLILVVATIVIVVIFAIVIAIVIAIVVAIIVVIIHSRHLCHRCHRLIVSVIVVSVIVISVVFAALFPLLLALCLLPAAMMTTRLLLLLLSYCEDNLRRTSAVIDLCCCRCHRPRPHQGPHTANKMIAAANATSRAVVVNVFGPIVAVWAAVEGMTLLPLKGSGFGKGHVLPLGTFSTYSYQSFEGVQVVILFLTMTILHITAKEHRIHPLNHDKHRRQ